MTTQNNYSSIQFGICVIENNEEIHYLIPVDQSVQSVLTEMLTSFNETFDHVGDKKRLFEPSEKYASTEKLFLPTNNENITKLKTLFDRNNYPTNSVDLSEKLSEISYYFALFSNMNYKIVGVKRPSQFKGLLKNKHRLIRFIDDTLKAIDDDIFKLDNDFDFIITKQDVDILHPSGFVFISDVDKYVLEKSIEATLELSEQIKFVDFYNISKFVGKSKTAAKLIASIRSRNDLVNIKKDKLVKFCKKAGINLKANRKNIEPEEENILDFLQILDRRLYEIELTDEKELYVAESRHKK